MTHLLLLAMLATAEPPYQPPAEIWYPQAAACAASALAAKGEEPTGEQVGELITFGLIVADVGRRLGRTKDQVESDVKAAQPFYERLRDRKPKAFAAHRAYCGALLDAERP